MSSPTTTNASVLGQQRARNTQISPFTSTTSLLAPFHPPSVVARQESANFGLQGDVALVSSTYQSTPDPPSNREVSTTPSSSAIQVLERIHGGPANRPSPDDALHERRATPSSSSRGECSTGEGSGCTSSQHLTSVARRECSVAAGSALHELNTLSSLSGPLWRIPHSTRMSLGSSPLQRQPFGPNSAFDQPRPAPGWHPSMYGAMTSNTSPLQAHYPPSNAFPGQITSSQSPEEGLSSRRLVPDPVASGTPSARPLPIPANPARNWEDEYDVQQPFVRNERVAGTTGFGGVVTLPESPASFPHPHSAIQYASDHGLCVPHPEIFAAPPSQSAQLSSASDERVQIRRQNACLESSSTPAASSSSSLATGPSPTTSTDVSPGAGFGARSRLTESGLHSTSRPSSSHSFSRLTLPTPVPFQHNPSSNPLPPSRRSPNNSSLPSDISGSATPPTIGSSTQVLALGPRVSPVSQKKTTGSGRTARKKTYACLMCEKGFDRPSTLKKHLLVHTGEKAFSCEFCSRRFGVSSNLNRHLKRCTQKPTGKPISFSFSSPIWYPTSSTSKLDLNLREQVSFSESSSSFALGTSARATVSTLNLSAESAAPSSSSSASASTTSAYVYPDTPSHSMARSARVPRRSDTIRSPGQSARNSGNRRQPPTMDRMAVSTAPDLLPSEVEESSLPHRRVAESDFSSPAGQQQQSASPEVNSSTVAPESVASSSDSQSTVHGQSAATTETDKPRKRARRPPSPSTWVPESLANFELCAAPTAVRPCVCPLPPVKPLYDDSTGAWIEERDSFASTLAAMMPPGSSSDEESSLSNSSSSSCEEDGDEGRVEVGNEENAEPASGHGRGSHSVVLGGASGGGIAGSAPSNVAFDATSRARERAQAKANRVAAKEARMRARLALYAPYHPIGWSGRLPGPAVVLGTGPEGEAVIERSSGPSGSGLGGGSSGGNMVGADMTNLRFEFITGPSSEGGVGSSSSSSSASRGARH